MGARHVRVNRPFTRRKRRIPSTNYLACAIPRGKESELEPAQRNAVLGRRGNRKRREGGDVPRSGRDLIEAPRGDCRQGVNQLAAVLATESRHRSRESRWRIGSAVTHTTGRRLQADVDRGPAARARFRTAILAVRYVAATRAGVQRLERQTCCHQPDERVGDDSSQAIHKRFSAHLRVLTG